MKAMKTLIAGAVLCSFLPGAFAASTVDMTVGGSIVPAACTPTLSNQRVNFGKVSTADLAADVHTDLRSQNVTLTIRCDAPTQYGIRSIDNKPGTHHGKPGAYEPFGLGLTPADERIGAYHLELQADGSQIDGAPVFFGFHVGSGLWTEFSATKGSIPYGRGPDMVGMHHTAGDNRAPVAIETARLNLAVHGYIAPASGLSLADEVALDGAATLEVVYL